MARTPPQIALSRDEEAELAGMVRAGKPPAVLRARIVLAAAGGAPNKVIAERLGTSAPTVGLWRERFAREGIAGLLDAPRSGRPVDDATVATVLAKAAEPPPGGDAHWSVRRLARATALPPSTVHRIWRAHRRRPELARVQGLDFAVTARLCKVVGLLVVHPAAMLVVDVAEPVRPRQRGPDALAPVEVDGSGVWGFLRRCAHAAPGELLIVATEAGGLAGDVEEWVARRTDARLQLVPAGTWPALAETWLLATASSAGDVGAELAAAVRRAAGSGPTAWIVEREGQVPVSYGR